MPETFICDHCGAQLPLGELVTFDGQELCEDCYEEHTCTCSRCGTRIWVSEDRGTDTLFLCEDCEDRYYAHCAGCGCLVDRDDLHYLTDSDDNDGYCSACYAIHARNQSIQSYCYKPEPIFYGTGPRYLGVELEIDEGANPTTVPVRSWTPPTRSMNTSTSSMTAALRTAWRSSHTP